MGNENERKPVSPQKLAANLANAQHSTGPRTEAGKEKSAQNSYQHGLYAKRLFPTSLDRDRDGADFDLIAEGVFDYYRPVGFMEKFWAEKVAIEMFRMARGLGYEQRFLDYRSSGLPSLESIWRFQASNNRQLAQAIEELERLQARRRARSKQNVLSDAEEDNPADEQDETEEQAENEDQLEVGPDVPPSGDCGTNPTISGEANDPIGISSPIDENCGTDPTPS